MLRQPRLLGPAIADAVSFDPTLIAAGGEGDKFQIIHTQFTTAGLSRTVERAVITSLLPAHPYALFIFSNADHSRWHFVNVQSRPERKVRRQPRRQPQR